MNNNNNDFVGKRLKDINYNLIESPYLSIFKDNKEVAFGFVGEVLKKIPHLADEVIIDTNLYFEALVLRI